VARSDRELDELELELGELDRSEWAASERHSIEDCDRGRARDRCSARTWREARGLVMPKTWRTLEDGRIEIAGVGVPTVSGADLELLLRVVRDWDALIAKHALRTGVPRAWIGAFIRAESAGNPAAVSPAGAVGLMQIMPPWWRGHSKEEMTSASGEPNAEIGTDLLATIRKTQKPGPNGPELPKVASAYNCGSDNAANEPRVRPLNEWGMCEDKGYISRVVANSNTLIERFGPAWGGKSVIASPKATGLGTAIALSAILWALAKYSRVFGRG
jgi:transglycosylase-like protein with SLT domain